MSQIRVDYHTHNARCGHAHGKIEEYIKSAISRGLTEIGISDHSPIYWLEGNDPMPSTAMAKDELDGYIEEVLKLKAQYADRIAVKLGLECDYVEDMENFYRQLLAKYPFDYVIGSVHYCLGRNVYDGRRWDGKADPMLAFEDYYRLVAKSAQSKLFDILAHTTAITAYAPKPIPAAIEPLQDAALLAIQESGLCVEVNTSGYRKMHTDPFPTARMIGKVSELGIPLTFSSDSHSPNDVGYARDKVEALFARFGINEVASFTGRQRTMIPLKAVEASANYILV